MILDLRLVIDKQILKTPLHCVQRIMGHLQNKGHAVNAKRIRQLIGLMRLMPIYQ